MKLLSSSVSPGSRKANTEGGHATVIVEESDDLWCVYNVIDCDDLVRVSTVRKVSTNKSGEKGSTTEKRRLTLTLRVTKVEYDGIADLVRLSGTNTVENDYVKVGAFHTAELGLGSKLWIEKGAWDSIHLSALFDAISEEKKKSGELGALAIEDGRARLYALSGATARHVASLDAAIPKSRAAAYASAKLEKAYEKFYQKLRLLLNERVDWQLARCVALVGEGSTAFYEFLRADKGATDAPRKALDKGTLLNVSTTAGQAAAPAKTKGISIEALEPLLADPTISKLIADTALAQHAKALDDFREAEAKDPHRVLYASFAAVSEAADRKAIDTLLILDNMLKNPKDVAQRRAYAHLVERATDAGSNVLAFPTRHTTADKLKALGGLAVVLRYPCPDLQDLCDNHQSETSTAVPAARESQEEEETVVVASAPHIETKQKKKPVVVASKQQSSKKSKPKVNYRDDDDYCDDDYYDY